MTQVAAKIALPLQYSGELHMLPGITFWLHIFHYGYYFSFGYLFVSEKRETITLSKDPCLLPKTSVFYFWLFSVRIIFLFNTIILYKVPDQF